MRLTGRVFARNLNIISDSDGIGICSNLECSQNTLLHTSSVCNWSGPDRSHGPKIRTGPKFGTGPRTGPSELPKVQYIFSVLKINIANLAAFVVKDMYSKFSNYR